MKRPHPWIGQSPEIISGIHHRKIGRARLLLDFYTEYQTDRYGRVYYGKPLTYALIRRRIVECPSQPTLERYNAKLRRGSYIETHTVVSEGAIIGFTVRILNQTKFRTGVAPRSTQQLPLYNPPRQMPAKTPRAVQTGVLDQKISAEGVPSVVMVGAIKSDGEKELSLRKNQGAETSKTRAQSSRATQTAGSSDWQKARARRQARKAHRILDEIERLKAVNAGANPYSDAASISRFHERFDELARQLEETGLVLLPGEADRWEPGTGSLPQERSRGMPPDSPLSRLTAQWASAAAEATSARQRPAEMTREEFLREIRKVRAAL